MDHKSVPASHHAVLASVIWMMSGEFVKFVGEACTSIVDFAVTIVHWIMAMLAHMIVIEGCLLSMKGLMILTEVVKMWLRRPLMIRVNQTSSPSKGGGGFLDLSTFAECTRGCGGAKPTVIRNGSPWGDNDSTTACRQ